MGARRYYGEDGGTDVKLVANRKQNSCFVFLTVVGKNTIVPAVNKALEYLQHFGFGLVNPLVTNLEQLTI